MLPFFIAFSDFIIAVMAMLILDVNPAKVEEQNVKLAADYRFSVDWPGPAERTDDIDVYVATPSKGVAFFRRKDTEGMVTIERDDLGARGDISVFNREEVSFRSPEDGTYHLSVHNYRNDPRPVDGVKVRYELVDQSGRHLLSGEVPMPAGRHEQVIGSFLVADGKVVWARREGVPIVSEVLR